MNSVQRSFLPTEGADTSPACPGDATGQPPLVSLAALALNVPAVVCAIDPGAAGQPPERARQLADIGFVAGERVAVLTRAWPGNDPLVVLVGHSRFALRTAEAACIRVREIA